MKNKLLYIINNCFLPILFVTLIWIIKAVEIIYNIYLYDYGIKPGESSSLINIITYPFIHENVNHLINNTYPILILGIIICMVYKKISNTIFLFSFILSGIILWLIGSENQNIIGASGVVYSLASFILISGFIRNHPKLAILSFLVIFLNFFNLWGIIEIPHDNVSQTAHLSGAISGAMLAIILRNKGPKQKKYSWEIEEEEEEENINYIFLKKKD